MNPDMMSDYIEVVADRLLIALDLEPIYHKKNPVRAFLDMGARILPC